MDLGLKGKIAIVTGGAVGIGRGIAECLAREGATVVIVDLNMEASKRLADQVGNKSIAIKVDLTQETDVDKAVKTTLDKFGKIDILVNNAGVSRNIKFVDINPEEWDRVFNVNVKGLYLITRAILLHMMQRRYGKIINISSMVGKEGIPDFSHYCASKFAVIGLTQSLAKEYAEYDLNINAVCPGVVRTSLWNDNLLPTMAKEQGVSPDEAFKNFCKTIPLGRPQTPEDIGNVVAFLASDISKNMTGQGINVTSGMQMH